LRIIYSDCKKVGEIKRGGSFGEIAIKTEGKRVATVVCRVDSVFGVISASQYSEVIEEYQNKK
jgi:CRP-like cAMP-binding protein